MNFKYDWTMYPEIKECLERIYDNTVLENSNKYNLRVSLNLIKYIEEYLYMAISNYDKTKISQLIENISFIKVTPISISLPIYIMGSTIMVNESLLKGDGNDKLEKFKENSEKIVFYLYYELSKSMLNFKSKTTERFSKIYSESLSGYDSKLITQLIVNNGWLFLEDVLSIELAERFTCRAFDKIRLSSNIDYRFYNTTTVFGLTLNSVGDKENHSKELIIHELLKKAINSDFSKEIISEYIARGLEFELYEILYIMGLIINEKSNRLPLTKLTEKDVNDLFIELHNLLIGLVTLEDEQYPLIDNIEEKRLNPFEKIRILRLIKNNKI